LPRWSGSARGATRAAVLSLRRIPPGLLPIYGLVFVAAMVQSALAPLGPLYAAQLHLSRVQLGELFAAAGFSTLLVVLPVGVFGDRLGSRRITVGAAVLIALSALGQGLAPDFLLLLASRVVFGVAFGTVWTAGVAYLSESGSAEQRSARLGATIPVSGVATSVGPAFAGVLAAQAGVGVPFAAIAAIAVLIAVALMRAPVVAPPTTRASRPSRSSSPWKAARTSRLVVAPAVIMVIAGLSNSVTNLLGPVQLRVNGLSINAIGVLLAAAAVLYILASLYVSRLGARAATVRAAGIATVLLGASLLLPTASTATVPLCAFILIRSMFHAAMTTIAYPIAAAGGEAAGIGASTALGLTNAGWAASSVVGPLAGGAIAQAGGNRAAFAVLLPLTLIAAVWLLVGRRGLGEHPAARTAPRPSDLPDGNP
jgi:predicted MFS family arabinose efflux permease